ncbi:rhodanese-like domain-containing protein [Evansella halocellulosilytica]|uniref:rhodanese-like domain-containing protein n=1 Tax=Evansella halocellulosilytica TaxID=2011013 RepID=UPI000BB679EC|nr:rhodanese-like domain-containing protein [Evansella halocellulosilytica]
MDFFSVDVIIISMVVIFIILRFIPVKGVKQIDTNELKELLKNKDPQFVDVRTQGEFSRYHIQGFKNIPLQQLSKKANMLNKNHEVVVICQSGVRSKKASKVLKKMGFKKIINVKGGVSTWRG